MEILERIEIKQGDITDEAVDAIVNAANTDLILGAGVAGAIRRKGGEVIQRECDACRPIPLGGAIVTTGGALPARFVIHAAVMHWGGEVTEKSIRDSVAAALRLAAERRFRGVALPALGTGVGGWDLADAARIILEAVWLHLSTNAYPETVRIVLWDDRAREVFGSALTHLFRSKSPAD